MGIGTKHRRKILFDSRPFVWYVKEDDDSSDLILHVLSADKKFIVHYSLAQPSDRLYVTVVGRDFPRATGTGGISRRFRCPRWDTDGIITPSRVRQLIEWCLATADDTVEVDCWGGVVPLGGHCSHCDVDLRGMISFNSHTCHQCGQTISERVDQSTPNF